jgi:hypothetical protein
LETATELQNRAKSGLLPPLWGAISDSGNAWLTREDSEGHMAS